jgi:hypothetical protein
MNHARDWNPRMIPAFPAGFTISKRTKNAEDLSSPLVNLKEKARRMHLGVRGWDDLRIGQMTGSWSCAGFRVPVK